MRWARTFPQPVPLVFPNTRDALLAAIAAAPAREGGPLLVYIHDTLALDQIYVSEAVLPSLKDKKHIEVLGKPSALEFDGDGYIKSPFDSQ